MKKIILSVSLIFLILFASTGIILLCTSLNEPSSSNTEQEEAEGEAMTFRLSNIGSTNFYVSVFNSSLVYQKYFNIAAGASTGISVETTDYLVISKYYGTNVFNRYGYYGIETNVDLTTGVSMSTQVYYSFVCFKAYVSSTRSAFRVVYPSAYNNGKSIVKTIFNANGGKFANLDEDVSYNNSTNFSRSICRLNGVWYSQASTTDQYLIAWCTYAGGKSSPLIVSKNASEIKITSSSTTRYYQGSFVYNGETYYYGTSLFSINAYYSNLDTSRSHTHIEGLTILDCAKKLVQTAETYVYYDINIATRSTYKLPTYAPKRDGYKFDGYNKSSTGTSTAVTSTTAIDTAYVNSYVYAQWEPYVYTINLDGKYYGGEFAATGDGPTTTGTSKIYLKYNTGWYTTSACTTTVGTITKPTYTGYTFKGYYTGRNGTGSQIINSSGQVLSGRRTYTTSNDTLYAYWTPTSYAVALNKGMGTGGSTLVSVTYKSTSVSVSAPSISNYIFNGWYTAQTGGSCVIYMTGAFASNVSGYTNSSGAWIRAGSATLYARWSSVISMNIKVRISNNGTTFTDQAVSSTSRDWISYRQDLNVYTSNTTTLTDISISTTSTFSNVTAGSYVYVNVNTVLTLNDIDYTFVGVSLVDQLPTNPSLTGLSSSIASVQAPTSSFTIYLFFIKKSTNQLKYDNTGQYFYFEDGEYPQSYVGSSMNTTLYNYFSAGSSATYSIPYTLNGRTILNIPVYTYTDGNKYAAIAPPKTSTISLGGTTYTFYANSKYFFKVEPIRWRVSDYGVSSTEYPSQFVKYATYKENFIAVSDLVLGFGMMGTMTEGQGYLDTTIYSVLDTYENLDDANQNKINFDYAETYTTSHKKFNNASSISPETTDTSTTKKFYLSSVEELEEYFTDLRAKPSQLVAVMLGINDSSYVDYWTRDLGSNLNNMTGISSFGRESKNFWTNQVLGYRITMQFSEGGR